MATIDRLPTELLGHSAVSPRADTFLRRHAEGVLLAATDLVFTLAVIFLLRMVWFAAFGCVAFLIVSHVMGGVYRRPRISLSALGDMKGTIAGASAPLMVASVGLLAGVLDRATVRLAIALIIAVAMGRVVAYRSIRSLRRLGRFVHPTVLIGTGFVADHLADAMSRPGPAGLRLVGRISGETNPFGPDALDDMLTTTGARRLVVAFDRLPDSAWISALRNFDSRHVEVFVVPRLYDFGSAAGDTRVQDLAGVPLVWLPRREWRKEQIIVKRAFDIVVASVALVVLSPIMLLAAIAVKVSSRGPVLFRQPRIGRYGAVFEIYKFRSMRVAEQRNARPIGPSDPRITPVGRFLRRTSIDELPQLWNVLKGQMSIVGPRPEQPQLVEEYRSTIPGYADRHRLPVGLTGFAQVGGLRGVGSSIDDRARADNFYIENWSLWRDIVILIRTISASIRGS